jgi:hypothetical protein
METASSIILGGATIRTDRSVVDYPDRFVDPKGSVTWSWIMEACGGPSVLCASKAC